MKTKAGRLISLSLLILAVNAEAKLKALIVDEQNNHAVWPKSTIMMKLYLEEPINAQRK